MYVCFVFLGGEKPSPEKIIEVFFISLVLMDVRHTQFVSTMFSLGQLCVQWYVSGWYVCNSVGIVICLSVYGLFMSIVYVSIVFFLCQLSYCWGLRMRFSSSAKSGMFTVTTRVLPVFINQHCPV